MDNPAKTANADTAPRPFLFEHSFDAEREAERKRKAEAEKPPEPTFSKEELDAAREAGYAAGHSAGLQEASSNMEAKTAALVAALGERLPPLSDEQAAANERLMQDGARVAVTIARKILPTYTAKHGTDELTALVTRCLETLISQPRIHVRVEPEQVEPITRHLEDAVSASGFDGRFLVEADETMGPSDCRLTWQSGGVERIEAEFWRDIDAAVTEFLGEPMADADAPAEATADVRAEASESQTNESSDTHPATAPLEETESAAAVAETPEGEPQAPDDNEIEPTTSDGVAAETAEPPTDMPDPLEDR